VHVNELIARPGLLSKYRILSVPGGFTYGDDVGSGKILANEVRSALGKAVRKFIASGKLIIGICNGFQVLVKMGLLPGLSGKADFSVESTLSLNDSGKFEDRWVHLKRDASPHRDLCVWTRGLPDVIYIPVAHAEGKFIPKTGEVLRALKKNGQAVFRYSSSNGSAPSYPENPNGSVDDIAGICDVTGRILGMMPHPERHVTYLQHPNWRKEGADAEGMGIGLEIFRNGVKFARENL